MAKLYKRTRNLFDPLSKTPFRLSRSRLENFLHCPRCFYLDRRLGIEPPGMPAFTLNSAVDELLKKEFDQYRRRKEPHPLMQAYKIDCIPFMHPMIDEWREPFKGIQYHHLPTNLMMFGAIDDLWVNKKDELFVVDYKSTSTQEKITLESEYRQAYKRQMEIYQWLLSSLKFNVSSLGYFVYCNADRAKAGFEGKLEFKMEIIGYEADFSWVEGAIIAAHKCLTADTFPDPSQDCEYCKYRMIAEEGLQKEKKPLLKHDGSSKAQKLTAEPQAQRELF